MFGFTGQTAPNNIGMNHKLAGQGRFVDNSRLPDLDVRSDLAGMAELVDALDSQWLACETLRRRLT
jgi:hypothetical protein